MTIPHRSSWPIHPPRTILRRIASLALCCLGIGTASAQSSGGAFVITKQVISSGSGQVRGAPFKAEVTLAQSAPGVQSGGTFQLVGGFHTPVAAAAAPDAVFKDSFEP